MLLIVSGVLIIRASADNSFQASYDFVISSPTTTTLSLAWSDSNDLAYDSVAVIHLSGSDSLFVAYMGEQSTATTETTLTRSPGLQYILYIKRLRGDSCAISNKDTMNTAWPELENRRTASSFREMWGARSWSPSDITYDSLYVSGSTGLDSTKVYWVAENMGIQAKAIGNTASCKVKLKFFFGHMRPSNMSNYKLSTGGYSDTNSFWGFKNEEQKYIEIDESGWSIPYNIDVPPSQHFYVRAEGKSGNGSATKLLLRLFRYGEIAQ